MVTLYIYENASKSKYAIYRDTHWSKNKTKNRPGNDLKIRPLLLKIKPGIGLKIGDIGLKIAAFLCGAFKFV